MDRTTLALLLALTGCAHPMNPQAGEDVTPGGDLATASPTDLAAGGPADAGAGADDLAHAAPADLAQPPINASCHVVINELETGDSQTGTAEFVELYNPCAHPVALTGWKLAYRAVTNTNAKGGSDSSTLVTWSSGSIAAGGYRVYAGSGFTGASDGALSSGLAANGAVGLRDGSGVVVDSLAYGSAGGGFMESGAAPAPPVVTAPGNSIQRLPNGADTDDNSADFRVSSAPTPGAANH